MRPAHQQFRKPSASCPPRGRRLAGSVLKEEKPTIEPKIVCPSGLDPDLLDPDAVRALQRLQSRDFEAYLVGGCVRDLLLGRQPKDFDIATAARPPQVKRTFPRNCRIIGRRFKLAHLHFNQNRKILEVATFRRSPAPEGESSDDLLITQDNEFGTAEEDALRRDFTVNALFFDPIADRIIDYAGGLDDIRDRVLCTIGEPIVRFREDPVRILRAAKFAGRLGLSFQQPTFEAMAEVAPDLARSAPPRLLEEILRLLRGGHSLESFQILRDIGALQVILPRVAEFLAEAESPDRLRFWRMLEALDHRMESGEELPNPVLLGVLFAAPVRAQAEKQNRRSWTTVAEAMIGPFARDLRLPRRDAGCLKRICGVQPRFSARGPKRFKTGSFLRDPYFDEALMLFELTCLASGEGSRDLERWTQMRAEHQPAADPDEEADSAEPERTSRSRNGGRKSRSRRSKKSGAAAEPSADGKPAGERKGKKAKQQTKKKAKTEKRTAKKAAKRGRKSSDRRATRRDKVETIEPEAYDLSAFDVELDPRRVPTFGVIVEGDTKKKKRREVPKTPPAGEEEDYRPPPPPGGEPTPPPPPPAGNDDEFGDW